MDEPTTAGDGLLFGRLAQSAPAHALGLGALAAGTRIGVIEQVDWGFPGIPRSVGPPSTTGFYPVFGRSSHPGVVRGYLGECSLTVVLRGRRRRPLRAVTPVNPRPALTSHRLACTGASAPGLASRCHGRSL